MKLYTYSCILLFITIQNHAAYYIERIHTDSPIFLISKSPEKFVIDSLELTLIVTKDKIQKDSISEQFNLLHSIICSTYYKTNRGYSINRTISSFGRFIAYGHMIRYQHGMVTITSKKNASSTLSIEVPNIEALSFVGEERDEDLERETLNEEANLPNVLVTLIQSYLNQKTQLFCIQRTSDSEEHLRATMINIAIHTDGTLRHKTTADQLLVAQDKRYIKSVACSPTGNHALIATHLDRVLFVTFDSELASQKIQRQIKSKTDVMRYSSDGMYCALVRNRNTIDPNDADPNDVKNTKIKIYRCDTGQHIHNFVLPMLSAPISDVYFRNTEQMDIIIVANPANECNSTSVLRAQFVPSENSQSCPSNLDNNITIVPVSAFDPDLLPSPRPTLRSNPQDHYPTSSPVLRGAVPRITPTRAIPQIRDSLNSQQRTPRYIFFLTCGTFISLAIALSCNLVQMPLMRQGTR